MFVFCSEKEFACRRLDVQIPVAIMFAAKKGCASSMF